MLIKTGLVQNIGGSTNGTILYDDVSLKYWDGALFGGSGSIATYNDTLNYITNLNTRFHGTEWGPWRLAKSADIQSLLNNPLVIITSLFFRTDDTGTVYVWLGRYDKIPAPGKHNALEINWKHIDQNDSGNLSYDYSKTTKPLNDTGSQPTAGRVGAWIVADAIRSSLLNP
jgi:hypothetical protein